MEEPLTRRGLLVDAVTAAVLLIIGATAALQFIRAEPRASYFFDWELVPATVMACGYGFSQPSTPIPALADFVTRQTPAFDCASLRDSGTVGPASRIAQTNRFGLYGPALAMATNGVSWVALDRYVAVLFGLSIALSYALLRMMTMRGVAVVGALALATAGKMTAILSHRDYIKELPFLAVMVVIAWLVAHGGSARRVWGGAAVGGLLLGIGIGCRADLMIMAPFIVAVLLLFVRWAPGEGHWRHRAVAVAVFAVGFSVTATPILRSISGGSNLSHTVLMGFMTPFTTHMGLEVPAYDVGSIYSDGYTYTMIAAQARVREADRGALPFGQPEYDRAGVRLYLDIARTFPADMLARALGAVVESVKFPFTRWAIAEADAMPGFDGAILSRVAAWRTSAFSRVEGLGLWIGLLALVVIASRDIRLASVAALAVAYFCGYTMMQFSRRHTFHLDVFAVAAMMVVVHAGVVLAWPPFRRTLALGGQWRRQLTTAFAFVMVLLVVTTVPLGLLRWYQQSAVTGLLDATLEAVRIPVPLTVTPVDDQTVLVSSLDLGQRWGPGPIDDVRDVRMDYVVAEFGGAGCGSEPFDVDLKYTGVVVTLDKEFNRTFSLRPPPTGERVRLMMPFFYEHGPYWLRADGLVLPAEREGCLQEMRRANAPGQLPFPFLYATLEPGWEREALYQRLRWGK